MTLGIGWVKDGSAFLVADSIVSREAPPEAGVTAMGEQLSSSSWTQDTAIKVVQLGPRSIGTLAGDAEDGLHALSDLHRQVEGTGLTLRSSLDSGAGTTDTTGFRLMLGEHRDGLASLYVPVDDTWKEVYDESKVVMVGQPSLEQRRWVTRAVQLLSRTFSSSGGKQRDPDDILINVIASCQGAHLLLPEVTRGIGGAFFGLHASADGVTRHRDTAFFIVDKRNAGDPLVGQWVITGWRGNVAFTLAVVPNQLGQHYRRLSLRGTFINEATKADFMTAALSLNGPLSPPYVGVIDRATGSTIVLRQDDAYTAERFGALSVRGPTFHLQYTSHLLALLDNSISSHETSPQSIVHHFIASQEDANDLAAGGWLSRS